MSFERKSKRTLPQDNLRSRIDGKVHPPEFETDQTLSYLDLFTQRSVEQNIEFDVSPPRQQFLSTLKSKLTDQQNIEKESLRHNKLRNMEQDSSQNVEDELNSAELDFNLDESVSYVY